MTDSTPKQPMKRCTGPCGRELPATFEYFYHNRAHKDGWDTRCKECKRAYDKANQQKRNEQARKKRAENPEKRREYERKWRAENKSKTHSYHEKWLASHLEQERERSRKKNIRDHDKNLPKWAAYRERNRVQMRERETERRHADPVGFRLKVAHHKAKKKGRILVRDYSLEDWQLCLNWFRGCCAYCGKPPSLWETTEMDHVIPVNSPDCPGTVPLNILCACRRCNRSKANRPLETWLVKKFGPQKAAQRLEEINRYFEHLRQKVAE